MQKLAKREEQIMQVLWNRGPSFVKEIVEDFPDPAPHYNTVSTMVRILEKKGFIDHKAFGKSHQYFAAVTKEEYQEKAVGDVLGSFFNNSPSEMITYFAKSEKINEEELKSILDLIKNQSK